VFNTYQGAQFCPFKSQAITDILKRCGIAISMDGRGRAPDNLFVERLWRTVKWEEVYLNAYQSIPHGRKRLEAYFPFATGSGPTSRWAIEPPPTSTGFCKRM
jgi:putative transposase